jgi:FtsP/CotA-like multicopper oxidase with cupredoxin domain
VQGRMDHENGREGNVLFVNGQVMPEIAIRSGEVQRWRVVNTSAARIYKLAIPGHTLLHVGNDGGLFEKPVPLSEIVVANSERVELLVR